MRLQRRAVGRKMRLLQFRTKTVRRFKRRKRRIAATMIDVIGMQSEIESRTRSLVDEDPNLARAPTAEIVMEVVPPVTITDAALQSVVVITTVTGTIDGTVEIAIGTMTAAAPSTFRRAVAIIGTIGIGLPVIDTAAIATVTTGMETIARAMLSRPSHHSTSAAALTRESLDIQPMKMASRRLRKRARPLRKGKMERFEA